MNIFELNNVIRSAKLGGTRNVRAGTTYLHVGCHRHNVITTLRRTGILIITYACVCENITYRHTNVSITFVFFIYL